MAGPCRERGPASAGLSLEGFRTKVAMKKIRQFRLLTKAQTATELAVFGAILVFVIGLIIKSALGSGHIQNQNLKASRLAMMLSFKFSEGLETGECGTDDCREFGVKSRDSASVVILEDRLTAESAKYPAIDRMPQIAGGGATFSRNLFMPMDADETWNIPVIDIFVNGRHFPLTIAAFKKACLREDPLDCSADTQWHEMAGWDATCARNRGCRKLYHFLANNGQNPLWCDGGLVSCPVHNLSANDRFNLDHQGLPDVPLGERQRFAWQWYTIMGFREEYMKDDEVKNVADQLEPGEEGIILYDGGSKNISADVDGDLKEEQMTKLTKVTDHIILEMQVLDFQDGDLDMTIGTDEIQDGKPVAGLTNDTFMYTFVKSGRAASEGTYLEIQNGRLCDPQPPYTCVRSIQKSDKIDIIMRTIQLSNNTGRFCRVDDLGDITLQTTVGGYANPVEVCCKTEACKDENGLSLGVSCFDPEYIDKTCMFTGNPDYIDPYSRLPTILYPKIYVRSRVKDLHGRKWQTDISGDPYVEFEVPKTK